MERKNGEVVQSQKQFSDKAKKLAYELAGPFMRASLLTTPTYASEAAIHQAIVNTEASAIVQSMADTALGVRAAHAQEADCVVSVQTEGEIPHQQVTYTSKTNPTIKVIDYVDGKVATFPAVPADTRIGSRSASTWIGQVDGTTTEYPLRFVCNTGENRPNRQGIKAVEPPPTATLTPTSTLRPTSKPAERAATVVPTATMTPRRIDNGNDNIPVTYPEEKTIWAQIRESIEWAIPDKWEDKATAVAVIGGGLWLASVIFGTRKQISGAVTEVSNTVNPNSPERKRARTQNELLRLRDKAQKAENDVNALQEARDLGVARQAVQTAEADLNRLRQQRDESVAGKRVAAAQQHLTEATNKLMDPLPIHTGSLARFWAGFTKNTAQDHRDRRNQEIAQAQAELIAAQAALTAAPETAAVNNAQTRLNQATAQRNAAEAALQAKPEYVRFQQASIDFQQAQQRAQQA